MGWLPTSRAVALVRWVCPGAAAPDGKESGLALLRPVRSYAGATISNQSSTSSPPSQRPSKEGEGDGGGGGGGGEGETGDASKRVEGPSLQKETSTREMFHAKAKETEDRLSRRDRHSGDAKSSDESK